MNLRGLWKISVVTSKEAEEAVAELLGARFGQPPSTYTKQDCGETTVTVYLKTKPDWSKAERIGLSEALNQIEGFGLNTAGAQARLTRLRPENWTESWKRHFQPLEVGARLLIKPSWSRRQPKPGQVTVVLDPGMSFGTGHHPTTRFCLTELTRHRRPDQPQSFLDIGTGSGILAICAAKLGYRPVDAFDFDPEAIRVARANARVNKVARLIRFECQDVTRLASQARKQYSVVCANLISNLLQAQRKCILAHLENAGLLILAGVLKDEFAPVRAAYEAAGLRLIQSRIENEWRSGTFLG